MGYASWSVSAGEQPTTAKWNLLGSNDAAFNDGTGIADSAITGAKIASYRLRSQEDTTNTIQTAAMPQTGWGQILGNGTSAMTEAVTFPLAVTKVLSLQVNFIGYKSGGAAATLITEFNTKIGSGNVVESINITTTGFTVAFSSAGTFGAVYHGYSWTIWGI